MEEFMLWVEEKEHESHYIYVLEFLIYFVGIFSGLFAIAFTFQKPLLWETKNLILLVIIILISQVIAFWIAYQRAVRITSCPRCNKYMPFLREEASRTYVRNEERYFRIPADEEHIREDVYLKLFSLYKVKYRCKHCGEEWNENLYKANRKHEYIGRYKRGER